MLWPSWSLPFSFSEAQVRRLKLLGGDVCVKTSVPPVETICRAVVGASPRCIGGVLCASREVFSKRSVSPYCVELVHIICVLSLSPIESLSRSQTLIELNFVSTTYEVQPVAPSSARSASSEMCGRMCCSSASVPSRQEEKRRSVGTRRPAEMAGSRQANAANGIAWACVGMCGHRAHVVAGITRHRQMNCTIVFLGTATPRQRRDRTCISTCFSSLSRGVRPGERKCRDAIGTERERDSMVQRSAPSHGSSMPLALINESTARRASKGSALEEKLGVQERPCCLSPLTCPLPSEKKRTVIVHESPCLPFAALLGLTDALQEAPAICDE